MWVDTYKRSHEALKTKTTSWEEPPHSSWEASGVCQEERKWTNGILLLVFVHYDWQSRVKMWFSVQSYHHEPWLKSVSIAWMSTSWDGGNMMVSSVTYLTGHLMLNGNTVFLSTRASNTVRNTKNIYFLIHRFPKYTDNIAENLKGEYCSANRCVFRTWFLHLTRW